MKILKCKVCDSEVDVIGNDSSVKRKIKCSRCDKDIVETTGPEIIIVRKRPVLD
jgi:ribosomal protein S27E